MSTGVNVNSAEPERRLAGMVTVNGSTAVKTPLSPSRPTVMSAAVVRV